MESDILRLAGGLEPICLSSPTKLWHFGGWVVWSTTCTCIFISYGTRLSPEPHHRFFFDFVYVCRNLNSLWFYSTGLSFSPFQNSALRAISELVYFLPFAFSYMEFPMDTSYGIQIMFLLPLFYFLLLKRETDQKRKTKFMSVLHVNWTVWVKQVNLFSSFPLKPAQQDKIITYFFDHVSINAGTI